MVLSLLDIVLRAYINYRESLNCFGFKTFLRLFLSNFVIVMYCMAMELFVITNASMYVVEIVIIYLLYKKAAEIYRYLKIMEFGLQYENYVKIIDLLLNIFIQAHIFVCFSSCLGDYSISGI